MQVCLFKLESYWNFTFLHFTPSGSLTLKHCCNRRRVYLLANDDLYYWTSTLSVSIFQHVVLNN